MRENIFLKRPLILWQEITTEKGLGEMRRLSDGGPDQREHGHGPGMCAWNYGWVEEIQILVAAGMCWAREKMTPG